MASHQPDPGSRGDAPTTVILSSVIALILVMVVGVGALAGRPEETLTVALTQEPLRAAAAATVEAAAQNPAQVVVGTATPRVQGTPAPLPPTPTGPPPEPAAGNAASGRRLFTSLACNSCHTIAGVSDAATGPPLTNIGNIAATRKPGYSVGQYLVESITNTNAYIVQGFQPNVMPATFATLPQGQVNDLVAYLASQKR